MATMQLVTRLMVPALLAAFCAGQDKYVSTTGSDANDGNTPGTAYATIQKAVNSVGSASTIWVAPGTYTEVVLVDVPGTYGGQGPASFTIEATGPGVVVQYPPLATRSVPWPNGIVTSSGKQGDAILWIHGTTNCVLRGITFDGVDDMSPATGTVSSMAVSYDNASGSVEDCTIHGVRISASSGAQGGLGLYLQGASTTVAVDGCSFYDIQKGHLVAAYDSTCNISNSTFTGRGPTTAIAENGIQFSYGAKGTIDECVVQGYWWVGTPWTSTGILLYDPGAPIAVTNSTLIDCQSGIYWVGAGTPTYGLTCTGNTLRHETTASYGYVGITLYDSATATGTFSIMNNVIENHGDVGVYTNVTGGTIGGNTFNGNGRDFYGEQGQDESAGGNNWDGNNWSNYAQNSGFPMMRYNIYGVAGAFDMYPTSTAVDLAAATTLATSGWPGRGPISIAAGDLDGDMIDDVVVGLTDGTLGTSDLVEVFLSGGGPLASAGTFAVGDDPVDCVLGNLNGDSNLDLVVVCKNDHTVHLFAGDGLGGFTALTTLTFASGLSDQNPTGAVIADLDGSGDLDLGVSFQGTLFGGGDVALLGNSGGGTAFAPLAVAGPTIGGAMGIAAGDFDGDMDVDVVITDAGATASDNKVHLLENLGGSFGVLGGSPLTAFLAPRGVVVTDIDGDSDMDLVVASFGNGGITDDGGLTTFLGDGAGAFTATVSDAGATGRNGASTVVSADLNLDSDPDTTRYDVVYLNLASANFTENLRFNGMTNDYAVRSSASSGGTSPTDLAIGDVDGDCAPDVLITDIGAGAIFIHAGIPRALAQTYGVGCAGMTGTPTIGTAGSPNLPILGNATLQVTLANAKSTSLAIFAGSTDPGPLPGACTNLLINPLVFAFTTFTNFSGQAAIALPVPNTPSLLCGNLYVQWAVVDNTGGLASLFTLSDGLRMRVGY